MNKWGLQVYIWRAVSWSHIHANIQYCHWIS